MSTVLPSLRLSISTYDGAISEPTTAIWCRRWQEHRPATDRKYPTRSIRADRCIIQLLSCIGSHVDLTQPILFLNKDRHMLEQIIPPNSSIRPSRIDRSNESIEIIDIRRSTNRHHRSRILLRRHHRAIHLLRGRS